MKSRAPFSPANRDFPTTQLGSVLGRGVWNAFASNLGAVPVPVVQTWFLVAIVLGILVAANLLAVAPALAARRSSPQQLLRAQ